MYTKRPLFERIKLNFRDRFKVKPQQREVGEAVGAGDNLRPDEALGAGVKQKDPPTIRRVVEATVCDLDPDAYNAYWPSTLI